MSEKRVAHAEIHFGVVEIGLARFSTFGLRCITWDNSMRAGTTSTSNITRPLTSNNHDPGSCATSPSPNHALVGLSKNLEKSCVALALRAAATLNFPWRFSISFLYLSDDRCQITRLEKTPSNSDNGSRTVKVAQSCKGCARTSC